MRKTKVAKRGRRPSNPVSQKLAEETVAAEADLRLRESNHRIKNHLQVLASALALQSRESADEPARQALLNACTRVAAVGRLHERLEEAELGDGVDVALFLSDLCADMRACFAQVNAVGLNLDVDVETARFPAKTVLPVGLMVSELVTNAVKHGGVESACTVRVCLRKEQARWRLKVVDDGPGMASDSLRAGSHLGGRILFALAHQLGGSIELDKTVKGASVSVLFPQ